MYIPKWFIGVSLFLMVALLVWSVAVANDRNPLPFPDNGSRIFSTASPEAKEAVVELLSRHGVKPRFRADSDGVERVIMWDGTIINYSEAEVLERLEGAAASIGLVASDPAASAAEAAAFLRQRGFEARVVNDVEPGVPISFVVTDALPGTVLNFRAHMTKLPPPEVF